MSKFYNWLVVMSLRINANCRDKYKHEYYMKFYVVLNVVFIYCLIHI